MRLVRSIFFAPLFGAVALVAATAFFACSEAEKAEKKASPISAAEAPDGFAVFRKYCVNCHGADGRLGLNGAKAIPESKLTQPERELLIQKGRNLMTPFEAILSPEEIRAVAEYTLSLK